VHNWRVIWAVHSDEYPSETIPILQACTGVA
jgi:hypothetical protein